MLLNFKVENYKSYKTPTFFTMVPGRYRKKSDHVVNKKQTNVLKFSSIYGGNASGKSNLVDAIKLTKSMILEGRVFSNFKELYFKLDSEMRKKTSKFEYEISIDDKIFAYGFSVNFPLNRLESEYLYEINNKSEKCIFDFDYINDVLVFDFSNLKDKNNRKKIEVYQDDFRSKQNEFFLSFINKIVFHTSEDWIENFQSVFNWFYHSLIVVTPSSEPIDIIGLFYQSKNNEVISIIDLIKTFDTGITDAKIEKISLEQFVSKIKQKLHFESQDLLNNLLSDIDKLKNDEVIRIATNEYYKIYKENDEIKVENLSFIHCNFKNAEFGLSEESDGTKRLIDLVNMIYLSQFQNKVFIVDEINRSLHPNLTVDFVEKFINLSSKTESQLIITTHEASLMDFKFLRQDELWVVDRQKNGASNLVSLSKYELRSDKVLNKDYLAGRYGGIPRLFKALNELGESNA